MRMITFELSGDAVPGALVMLNYRHPDRGGRSTVKYVVGDEDTLETVAARLAEQINGAVGDWQTGAGDFKAKAKGARVNVMCSDLVSDVEFSADVEGDDGALKVEVEEVV